MNVSEFAKIIPLSKGCEVVGFHECGLVAICKKAGIPSHPNPSAQNAQNRRPDMKANRRVFKQDALQPAAAAAQKAKKTQHALVGAKYNLDGEYYSWVYTPTATQNPAAESSAVPPQQTPNAPETKSQKLRLYLINRLDSPTSGIILAATDSDVAKAAKAALKAHTVRKIYYAICRRPPNNAREGTWCDFLQTERGLGFVRSRIARTGIPAKTLFKIEGFDDNGANLALVRLEPLTGRTHQLRVQCAFRKMPIVGDATYGDFAFNRKMRAASGLDRLFLHCAETSLELDTPSGKISFTAKAPLPDSFAKLLKYDNQIAKFFRRG